ncbi:MAG: hypothetical protein WCC27_10085 [Acidobacteriaceae bacterium]
MAARKKSLDRTRRKGAGKSSEQNIPKWKRTIIGMGQFEGGPPDLATNRKYLAGLGLSRSEILRRRSD